MASRLVSGILSHSVMFSNLLIVALSLISFELGSIVKSNLLLRLSAWDTDANQTSRSQLHVGTFTIVQWNSPAPLKLLISTFYNHMSTAKAIIKVTLYGCKHSICEWLHKPWFKWNAESPNIWVVFSIPARRPWCSNSRASEAAIWVSCTFAFVFSWYKVIIAI